MGAQLGFSSPNTGSKPDIKTPTFEEVKPGLKSGLGLQRAQLNKYVAQSPLLSRAETGAINVWDKLSPDLMSIIASGGALTPEGERDVSQATRALYSAQGNVHGNQALGAELLNREAAQQARLNTALTQAAGGINQLTGVEGAEVANYATLANPVFGLVGDLAGFKTQGEIAEAQFASQQSIAAAQLQQKALNDTLTRWSDLITGGTGSFSDERLKTKVRDTGIKTDKKIPIKKFEYKTRPGAKFIGVLAQDVEKHDPGHVFTDKASGIKMVSKMYSPILLEKAA